MIQYYEKNGHTAFKSNSGTEYYVPEPAVVDVPHFTLTSKNGTNDCRCFYECDTINPKGERLVVELTFCENFDGKRTLPRSWYKDKRIDHVLESWWGFDTYVYNDKDCYAAYDPTMLRYEGKPYHDDGRPTMRFVNNYEFFGEATEENALRIFAECYRRFMACEPTEVVHEEYFA